MKLARALGLWSPLPLSVLAAPLLLRAYDVVSSSLRVVLLLPLLWVVFSRGVARPLLRRGGLVPRGGLALHAAAVAAILVAALLAWLYQQPETASLPQAVGILVALVFPLAAAAGAGPAERRRLLACALASLPLYLAANLALWAAGGGSVRAGDPAVLLGAAGVSMDRVVFPLAGGVNNFGGVGGAALALGLVLLLLRREARRDLPLTLAWAAAGTGLLVALLTDNRAALVFGVVAAAAVASLRALWVTRLVAVAALLPLLALPFVAHALVPILEVPDGLARSAQDVGTLNGRLYIWDVAYTAATRDPVHFLFGHGLFGQVPSGAGVAIGQMFPPDDPGRFTHTAHSWLLQALLDVGLVGTLVFAAFLGRLLLRLFGRADDPVLVAAGTVLLYFVLSGTVEAHGLPEIQDSFPVFTLLAFLAAAAVARPRAQAAPPPDASSGEPMNGATRSRARLHD